MDSNFQTSFIPKKPIVEERTEIKRPMGIFTIAAIFIFIAMILMLVGSYFYRQVLAGDIKSKESTLSLAKGRFEPQRITELQVLDRRLRAASELLGKHIAVTPIFEILQQVTLKTIRYTRFSYEWTEKGRVLVRLGGIATGYRSIAIQSDLFAENKYIIDSVFSNLSLDEKGNVLFDLEFYVEGSLVDYKQNLQRKTGEVDIPTPPPEPVPDLNQLETTENNTSGVAPMVGTTSQSPSGTTR